MNKTSILLFLFLILLAAFSFGGVSAYADENKDKDEVKPNKIIEIFDNLSNSKVFEMSGEGKNKTQFRIKDNHNEKDSEFMIKGVISASSSGSITIDGKTIKIDSSVTGEVKIVGKIEVGAYAMAKGIVKDSDLYAEKIVVDQRNKRDIEEADDEEVHPSITPTATSSSTVEAEEDHEQKEEFTINRLILSLEDILSSLRKFVLGI